MAALGTRLLKIDVDGVEYEAEVSAVTVESGESDSDFVTFKNAAEGGARDYTLNFTAVQNPATGSLWSEVFDNTGDIVPVLIKPEGNTAASVEQPHFACSAVIGEPDGTLLGGEANASPSARMTIECSWKLEGRPTRVTA